VLREGVDGVDELEALVEVRELFHGGKVEEGALAHLRVHPTIIILILSLSSTTPPYPQTHLTQINTNNPSQDPSEVFLILFSFLDEMENGKNRRCTYYLEINLV
jgi:hypothetical protein